MEKDSGNKLEELSCANKSSWKEPYLTRNLLHKADRMIKIPFNLEYVSGPEPKYNLSRASFSQLNNHSLSISLT